ncbi:MAG: phosphatidylserine/phosphatidylglycerophosphate/cardiolipin synthase family protein [Gammaproteobacteria bacterium]|nr:phosphatidylserine/phosphatidylglycerophosphate/cardiolipin synthase family protein [Gammaproteobacteria bacterium]
MPNDGVRLPRGDARAEVLVDSEAVWASVQADLAAAREYAFIQTYSFEGDWVGTALSDALLDAPAPDRRLLVDSYTRANQNDRWIALPGTLFDPAFRAEVRNTGRLVRLLRAGGVGVRFGRPFGILGQHFLNRDHKKLILFDDRVSYIGGINFSEHNFAWHDLMVRVEDADVACFLRRDFESSWEGRSERGRASFPERELDLHLLPGAGNRAEYRDLLGLIDAAERSIDVISPYVSPPFTDHLAAAAARGIRVRIVTPRSNNKAYLQKYLLAMAARAGFEVWLFEGGMIHMKCMLIDDGTLVTGSSNFDLMSYNGFLAEIVAVFRSREVIEAFRRGVLEPDLRASRRFEDDGDSGAGRLGRALRAMPIRVARRVARVLGPG